LARGSWLLQRLCILQSHFLISQITTHQMQLLSTYLKEGSQSLSRVMSHVLRAIDAKLTPTQKTVPAFSTYVADSAILINRNATCYGSWCIRSGNQDVGSNRWQTSKCTFSQIQCSWSYSLRATTVTKMPSPPTPRMEDTYSTCPARIFLRTPVVDASWRIHHPHKTALKVILFLLLWVCFENLI
jgi:hypothetical protein